METISVVDAGVQVSSAPEVRPERKIGIEIVRSAPVGHRRYHGPRPGRSLTSQPELSPHQRIVVLRGQLTLLRKRLQAGLPITASSIRRAEDIARSLEEEAAA